MHTFTDQGFRAGQIAHLTGCSHQRISKLMASSGIGPPAPREVLRTLDPLWLREQYEETTAHSPRSPPTSVSRRPTSRHARKLGLAIRYGVAAHKHILVDHGGPDAFSTTIWTVFASCGVGQRAKRFLAIPGHPDLNHAAKHLGVRKPSSPIKSTN